MVDRPTIGTECVHDNRPGEIRSIYPANGVFYVVGKYLDTDSEDTNESHFTRPLSECASIQE